MLLDHRGQPMPTAASRERAQYVKMARAKLRAAYDAAQTTSENTKHWRWADDLSAAEANSLEVRKTLRSRSRYECLQSNSFAKGIVCTLANDFVSTGPNLQVQLEEKAVARRIEVAWRRWAKSCGLVRKLRTARLAKCVDGEAFILAKTNPRVVGPVKLDIRLVESDQISTPGWFDGLYENAVDGIKFDDYGNPSEYHELPFHPGDRRGFIKSLYDYSKINPRFVIHLFANERPGQARGIPEVTPALPLFAMLRRYTLATVLAAETAADFAILLQTQSNAFEQDGATPQNPFESVDIDRGMMTALPYGYEMAQLKAEQPTTTYVEFRNALLQEIARTIHMPTNKARGDSSGYNYSSGRLDHQIYYHALEVERIDWENDCLDRIFGWWMEEARLVSPEIFTGLDISGDIREVIASMPHRWTWRPATSINPKEDATAANMLIETGLMTERQYLLEHGMDPESHWADIEEETPRRAARIRMLAMGQQQAVDAGPAQPDNPDADLEPADPDPMADDAVTT